MRLRTIIIVVVSLLGLLFIISCILFAFHYRKVRAHRNIPQMAQDSQRPIRQLTVRSGKVIPISEAVQTPSTRDFRSVDLSTIRSGNSIRSKFSQDKILQSPRATIKSYDRRHSSTLADLEAQNEATETWEAKVQRLQNMDERLRDPRYINNTRSREWDRRVSISSQTITASLKKAYRGPPVFETQAVEIPPTLGSRPTEIRTMVRKKKSDSDLGRHLPVKTYKNGFEATRFTPGHRKQQSGSQTSDRNTSGSLQGSAYAAPTNAVQPPQSVFLNRHSSPAEQQQPLDWTRNSFFSTSVSTASSAPLQQPEASEKVPVSSLADHQDSQSGPQPAVRDSQLRPKSNLRSPHTKPHKIDTKVSNIRDTSFIDSATSSTTTAPNLHRRESMLSSSSLATFASSDLSSTWTFGNAQPIAILPGIMSRARASSPAPTSRRPKSKYGRFPKKRKEKELPIAPRSPLAR